MEKHSANNKKFDLSFLKSRKFKHGSIATAVTVVVIVLVILLNVVLNTVSDNINLSYDITANNFYGMSQQTKDYISKLNKNVEILVLANEEDFKNTDGEYYVQANSIIKQYPQYSEKINVKYLNLDANPNISKEYAKDSIQANDVIVKTDNSYKVLSSNDLFEGDYNYYSYSYSITASKAEQAITSAILSLTSEAKTKVEIITGFEEDDYSALQKMLENNNYSVSTTQILTKDLSLDTSIVFIYAPRRDYDSVGIKKLNTFMEKGKQDNKTIVYVASPVVENTKNLNGFLEKWGLSVGDQIAFESDTNNLFSTASAFFTIAQYGDQTYTSAVQDTSIPVAMPESKAITLTNKKSIEHVELLSLSDKSGLYPADADENWTPGKKDITGPLNIASLATKTDNNKKSHVCVIGASLAFDSSLLERSSVNNSLYFTSLFNSLSASESGVIIESKSVQYDTFSLTAFQSIALGIILVIVVPIVLIIVGIVVWLRRRKK